MESLAHSFSGMSIFVFRAPALALFLAVTASCAHRARPTADGGAEGADVTGTVSYRERVALPADAIVEIDLNEDPRVLSPPSDTAPGLLGGGGEIASTTVSAEGRQVPLPFTLRYDAAKIRNDRLYVLNAWIRSSDGEVLFTTSILPRVITAGSPTHVALVLSRPAQIKTVTELVGSKWILEELNGMPVLDDAAPTLEFPERGKVAGTGSCNRFFGTVNSSESSMSFGAIGSTRMACASAIAVQEAAYFEALESANRFTIQPEGPSARVGTYTLWIYGGRSDKPLRFKGVLRIRP